MTPPGDEPPLPTRPRSKDLSSDDDRSVPDQADEPLLIMTGIVKSFAGVRALDGVDLEVLPGEVHCLLGQNGAGKSTLIKVMAGVHRPDEGTMIWRGERVSFNSPAAAVKLGVATMYQELDLVDGLSVAENIFLGHEHSIAGFTRRAAAAADARQMLVRLGHPEVDPHAEVRTLSMAQKQVVSMARALSHDVRMMIMDEPSAVLDPEEVESLFRLVGDLRREGVAVVYISHRLEEIQRIGDRMTVLKDGRAVAVNLAARETSTQEVIRLMTGRSIEYVFPGRPGVRKDAPVVLDVDDLSRTGEFHGISFNVLAGEIVGIAGLVGAGRSEVIETVYGARRSETGTITVDDRPVPRGSVPAAVAAGMGLCPEERKAQGLLLGEPVSVNITVASMRRFANISFLRRRAERRAAVEQIRALDIRPADPDKPIRMLSGGNQQKAVLARWLERGCRVLLLDEPTRGVDVGARADIYAVIRRLADSGVAVVVVSSEVEEVLGLADRVLVMADGRIVHSGPAAEIDEHTVLDLVMKGHAA
ncbi:monosaccharide ABC transporter ATP-binding protein, CUT2 family [Nakamurella panacisegetis]|uniref:Monosaccharide ABC transporter ATP-binding protein, CUT2 family n=2 Tax=Nakamurella panacisegetis TaxID=1090615 RepID=A0A1H0HMX7_9ACTN|nr:monosaccharide ABC transporter ATP-binding protein, CUT2 family [Nakamurella panacisegetis]